MLSTFFAIKVNKSGNKIVPSPDRDLFRHLRIGKEYPDVVAKHQGQYPVICFTFRDLKLNTYKAIRARLIDKIMSLYDEHLYLYEKLKLTENQKQKFEKYLKGNVADADFFESLKFLSSLLKMRHRKKVYMFIDEYDAPLNATHDTKEYGKTLDIMRLFLGGGLKGNDNVEKSVVTGITKIAKAGLFSDVNNVVEYSILDDGKYSEYFGFTEEEVQSLLLKAKMTDPKIRNGVKDYYNGYQIQNCTLYNPWSIISFFNKNKLDIHWVNTEGSVEGDRKLSTSLLMSSQMQSTVRDLIRNCSAGNKEAVEIVISPVVVLHNLKESPQAIWTLLAYGGYLALSNVRKMKGSRLLCDARIPNREVLEIFEDSISSWFTDILGINLDYVLGEATVLNIDDMGEFESLVRKLLLVRKDIFGDANESLFHSFVEGLFLFEGTTHRLSSEKIAGSGRSDSIFCPIKGRSCKIIIHEYKILGSANSAKIDRKIQEALWQVYEHYYFEEAVSKYNEFEYSHYQQIKIRGMVAFVDENTNNLGMRSASILHDMSEVRDLILPLFKSLKENELRKLKSHYQVDEFIKEFKSVKSLQTILNQLESCDSVLGRRSRSEQEDSMGDKPTKR